MLAPATISPGKCTPRSTRETLTALAGRVFDMKTARWQHHHLQGLFGGRDMTLWHLQRMDSSDGQERESDVRAGRFNPAQSRYLNEFLHEYDREYEYVGRLVD